MLVGELKKRLEKVADDLEIVVTMEPLNEDENTYRCEIDKVYVDTDPTCLAFELVEIEVEEEDGEIDEED